MDRSRDLYAHVQDVRRIGLLAGHRMLRCDRNLKRMF